jgi:hypothetical protein
MKRFLMAAVVALAVSPPFWSRADDQIRDASPDGKFAMLLKDEEKNVSIELIEVASQKVVLELANTGYNNSRECKLFWSADSQRVAFFEKGGHFGATTVYFRSESGFTESSLPELAMDGCATAAEKKELKAQGVLKFIEGNTTPKQWLNSGALVVVNDQGWETNDGDLRGCTQTVTIGFDAKHKASVRRVTGKKAKDY